MIEPDKALMKVREENGGIQFTVRVIPRSNRSEIVGEHDGAVKVKLSAPPVDGAANDELIKLLAKKLGVARSAVSIVSGATSRTKQLRISGATTEHLRDLVDEPRPID